MKETRLLIVDDDRDFCADLEAVLGTRYDVAMVHDGESALATIGGIDPDVVLLDVQFRAGEINGVQILERIRDNESPPPVIMLSGSTRVGTVVDAMKLGAFHYVTKPAAPPELLNLIERALATGKQRRQIEAHRDEVGRLTGSLICGDEKMHRVLDQIDKVAGTAATVLITGESGTGKEMIARRIHEASSHSGGPFVGINCSAFPADLIESEIFGHAANAFTNASARIGKLELAKGGTFFMDEVGEASPELQVKLLRALGEKVFSRLGENTERPVACRILAATSRDLEREITVRGFREDLYYRLNIYRIYLPPLRERPGDIGVLAHHFLNRFVAENGRQISGFSPAVLERIERHPWPGNVRELRNFVERAVINCSGGMVSVGDMFGEQVGAAGDIDGPGEHLTLRRAGDLAKEEREREYCRNRLQEAGGNVTRAAELSGVLRQAFQRKLRELGIDPDDFKNM